MASRPRPPLAKKRVVELQRTVKPEDMKSFRFFFTHVHSTRPLPFRRYAPRRRSVSNPMAFFFVAATQQEPHLKTREFLNPAWKAAEQLGGTVEIPRPLKHIMASSGGHGKSIDTAQNKLSDLTGNLRHRSSYMLNGRRMVLEVGSIAPRWCHRQEWLPRAITIADWGAFLA